MQLRIRHRFGSVFLVGALVALLGALAPMAVWAAPPEPTFRGYNYRNYVRPSYDHKYSPGPRDYHPAPKYDDGKPDNKHDKHDKYDRNCDHTYRTKRGDTLSKIAKHSRVSSNAIAKANSIKNPNRLYPGVYCCIMNMY